MFPVFLPSKNLEFCLSCRRWGGEWRKGRGRKAFRGRSVRGLDDRSAPHPRRVRPEGAI